ncbi:MAG: LPS export ABC transporter periplasmic protein LptC [Candidatus Solibacter sp.]|nr:LPS export ABC transporter periplasmic protein LptC [Candidatus Solibacter sp.]
MRWLLLVAIAAILGGVGYQYRAQKRLLAGNAPATPAPLSTDLRASAEHWHYRDKDLKTGRVKSDIDAESFQQVKDDSRVDLKNVTLKIYSKDGKTYDLVKSAAASFNTAEKSLYSQGDVEITLDLPTEGPPARQPTVIKTSGLTCDSSTGRVDTDQPSSFIFEKGDGKATGATYDPASHELLMKSDVEVHWNPPGKNAKPMKIEAATLAYHETTSEIWLKPWGRMTRAGMEVEGNEVVVRLQDKAIRKITAIRAHGSDDLPNRKLRYAADELAMDFDDDGLAQKINGSKNASLISTTEASETTVTADRVDLNFQPDGRESVLTQVAATGNGVVTSKPLAVAGRPLSETHALRSETLEMKMRPGGREMESVVTKAPGTLEFLPNLPAQHHRLLEGKDFVIAYGPQNRVDSFRAANVKTRTDPNAEDRRRNRQVSTTTSRDLEARFDPKTSRLTSMQQSGDFAYEEGDRKARAAKATMDAEQNVILLDTGARIWDAAGSTAADHIRLDQRTGDFLAEGNVTSSRLPDRDQKKNSEMLSGEDPLQATARKMDSRNRNRQIHYEGAVQMWQGANRIRADVVDVDRSLDPQKRSLVADGHVVTNLWEAPKDDKKKTAAPALTEVHAGHMVYTEAGRLTHYTGGVQLNRPGLQVKGQELRAFLGESGGDSRLEKAFADGAVEILSTGKDRTRSGTGDHAEYYTADQKVILRGVWVRIVEKIVTDSQPRTSEGTEAVYFANDDRLVVTGELDKPGNSRFNRKKGK